MPMCMRICRGNIRVVHMVVRNRVEKQKYIYNQWRYQCGCVKEAAVEMFIELKKYSWI
jgi:uncharacterized membrane protein